MNKQGPGKIEYLDYTWNPVFMKNSLKALMGAEFIQEWPEGLK
jgi:hypothetical protein